jgi:hypothetical protein
LSRSFDSSLTAPHRGARRRNGKILRSIPERAHCSALSGPEPATLGSNRVNFETAFWRPKLALSRFQCGKRNSEPLPVANPVPAVPPAVPITAAPMAPATAAPSAPAAPPMRVDLEDEFLCRFWRQCSSRRKRRRLDRTRHDAHANGDNSGTRQSPLYPFTAIHGGHGSLPGRTDLAPTSDTASPHHRTRHPAEPAASSGRLPMRAARLKRLML